MDISDEDLQELYMGALPTGSLVFAQNFYKNRRLTAQA
jgi:hypothetical protein